MYIFYSPFHECYVAQAHYNGELFTARDDNRLIAIHAVLQAIASERNKQSSND